MRAAAASREGERRRQQEAAAEAAAASLDAGDPAADDLSFFIRPGQQQQQQRPPLGQQHPSQPRQQMRQEPELVPTWHGGQLDLPGKQPPPDQQRRLAQEDEERWGQPRGAGDAIPRHVLHKHAHPIQPPVQQKQQPMRQQQQHFQEHQVVSEPRPGQEREGQLHNVLHTHPHPIQPPSRQQQQQQHPHQDPQLQQRQYQLHARGPQEQGDLHQLQRMQQHHHLQRPLMAVNNPLYEPDEMLDPAPPPPREDEWAPTTAALNVSRDIIEARRPLWDHLARGLHARGCKLVMREIPGLDVDLCYSGPGGAIVAVALLVPEYCAPRFDPGVMTPESRYFELAAELVASMGAGFSRGVLVFEGDARFRSLTESFKGGLIAMAAGAGSGGGGGGGGREGGGGMRLDCVSCEPGQTAEIILETIAPAAETLDSGGGAPGRPERLRAPSVSMPASASAHEAELARLFPLLNPMSACALISGVRAGAVFEGVDVSAAVQRGGRLTLEELGAVGKVARCPAEVFHTTAGILENDADADANADAAAAAEDYDQRGYQYSAPPFADHQQQRQRLQQQLQYQPEHEQHQRQQQGWKQQQQQGWEQRQPWNEGPPSGAFVHHHQQRQQQHQQLQYQQNEVLRNPRQPPQPRQMPPPQPLPQARHASDLGLGFGDGFRDVPTSAMGRRVHFYEQTVTGGEHDGDDQLNHRHYSNPRLVSQARASEGGGGGAGGGGRGGGYSNFLPVLPEGREDYDDEGRGIIPDDLLMDDLLLDDHDDYHHPHYQDQRRLYRQHHQRRQDDHLDPPPAPAADDDLNRSRSLMDPAHVPSSSLHHENVGFCTIGNYGGGGGGGVGVAPGFGAVGDYPRGTGEDSDMMRGGGAGSRDRAVQPGAARPALAPVSATKALISSWRNGIGPNSARRLALQRQQHEEEEERQLRRRQPPPWEQHEQHDRTLPSAPSSLREAPRVMHTGGMGGDGAGAGAGGLPFHRGLFESASTIENRVSPIASLFDQASQPLSSQWQVRSRQQQQEQWQQQQQQQRPMRVIATTWGGGGGSGGGGSGGLMPAPPPPPSDPNAPRWGTPEKLRGMKRKQAKGRPSVVAGGGGGSGGGKIHNMNNNYWPGSTSSGASDVTWFGRGCTHPPPDSKMKR